MKRLNRIMAWLLLASLGLTMGAPIAQAIDVAPGLGGATISISGSGTGTGTTSGTSTTGFGRGWFPSTITGTLGAGQQMIAVFLDDLQVAFFRRDTGCGNCLQVAVSTDGGVTGTFFSTDGTLGNSISAAHRVPSSPPRFLASSIGGPLNIIQSANVSSGWTAVVGLTLPVNSWASNPAGSTVLSYNSGAAPSVQVCRSTNQGITFGSCNNWGIQNAQALSGMGIIHVSGTTWLFHNATAQIWRSVDDGITFALAATPGGGNGISITCLPNTTTCLFIGTDQIIRRSTDSGSTWVPVQTGITPGAVNSGICAFTDGANAATLTNSPPVGLSSVVSNTTWSSPSAGLLWYPGKIFGSHWDGVGGTGLTSMACRNGRGIAAYSTGGATNQMFALYNPLTAPGDVLTSSAGGYNISAAIQAGIILNTTPVTSAANTAAVVTLTNTPGSRICLRSITLFSSAAGTATLTVTDGVVVVLNFGTLVTGTSAALTTFDGTPLLCSQTSNNLVVNIGAAGAAVTTTTSTISDRYPN